MNPSSLGWINKFGHIIQKQEPLAQSDMTFFLALKQWGFLYGASTAIPQFIIPEHPASFDEKTKINLIYGLYTTYKSHEKKPTFTAFLKVIIQYYKDLGLVKTSFLDGLLGQAKEAVIVEKIMEQRVFPQANLFHKTLGSLSVNTHLYLDILCFKRYLLFPLTYKDHMGVLESLALEITQETIQAFPEHQKKLEQLIKFSLTLGKKENSITSHTTVLLSEIEKIYFVILACVNAMQYRNLKAKHEAFLVQICKRVNYPLELAKEEANLLGLFIQEYKNEIPGLKTLHIGEQLYDNLSILVNKLILRNHKRLLKELKGSQELLVLLTKSTHSELSEKEKKKIQQQLADIFKSIPSLAIFILPGGALLLPIVIKLIPKLLPTAFDENRIPE